MVAEHRRSAGPAEWSGTAGGAWFSNTSFTFDVNLTTPARTRSRSTPWIGTTTSAEEWRRCRCSTRPAPRCWTPDDLQLYQWRVPALEYFRPRADQSDQRDQRKRCDQRSIFLRRGGRTFFFAATPSGSVRRKRIGPTRKRWVAQFVFKIQKHEATPKHPQTKFPKPSSYCTVRTG